MDSGRMGRAGLRQPEEHMPQLKERLSWAHITRAFEFSREARNADFYVKSQDMSINAAIQKIISKHCVGSKGDCP